MNVVSINGRLGKDVELLESKDGKAFGNFSLAVKDNIDYKKTHWINCVCFGKTAELMAEYCKKGNFVAVSGGLSVSSYEKEGVKHTNTKVIVERFDFPLREAAKGSEATPKKQVEANQDDEEDEFPF